MPSKKALATSGFLSSVDAALTSNQAAIQEAGVDVAAMRSRISTANSAVTTSDATRDDAERIFRASVVSADTTEQTGYDTGSSIVDAVAGALGKKTPLGQQFLAIRADANRKRKGKSDGAAPKPPIP